MNPDVQSYLATYQHTQAYLRLSAAYCDYLGGIRWSSDDDALVYRDGRTFAFCAMIADFLEGFSSGGRVVPFGCVLHGIHLLQNGRKHPDVEVRRLHQLFSATGSNWRNAGALAAALADGVPEPVQPPRLEHVCRRLRDRAFPIRWFIARFHESPVAAPEAPAIAPPDFERLVSDRLAAYSEDELRGWLQHGRGPVHEAGKQLAREQPSPRSLTGVLAALLLRPRLAGAETYVTRLVGALTLPPRRLTPQELPVGGYADMTTHGALEHILPSQHALDELEFLRRFAERELLFFRREEPPAQNRQEIAVLIDQGVRTWGDVRVVLAAAALALGKQAITRTQGFRLAGSSNGGRLLDPLDADAETLGELVEASDLSFHPGAALEAVLETPCDALRDIVLLTHPRNLSEADVLVAARRAGPRDRVFAVALDEAGSASVSEIRHGAVVTLRQFRVEFAASQPPPSQPGPAEPLSPLSPWTGDVEPVPFPFRFGTQGPIKHFAFDYDSRHLLTVTGNGMLHLWGVDGNHREVLPRPFADGVPLVDIRAIVGVASGVVVVGVRDPQRLLAAHYDIPRRRCRIHDVGPAPPTVVVQYVEQYPGGPLQRCKDTGNPRIVAEYIPQCHTVSVAAPGAFRAPSHVVQLTTMSRSDTIVTTGASQPPVPMPAAVLDRYRYVVDTATGEITQRQAADGDEWSYLPESDGMPILRGASIAEMRSAGDTCAILATLADRTLRLLVLRGDRLIREHRYEQRIKEPRRFLLSPDGNWLAREWGARIVVENIDTPVMQMTTRAGGFPAEAQLYLGKDCLVLSQDRGQTHWHLVDWSDGTAKFYYEKKPKDAPLQRDAFREAMQRAPLTLVRAASASAPPSYDPQRFVAVAAPGRLGIALDRFGQVVVFRGDFETVCMFMAFRDRLAAWLPDGSRCGSAALGLGPETPGARARLGKLLKGL